MFVPPNNQTKKTIKKIKNKYLKKYWTNINLIKQLTTASYLDTKDQDKIK